jgi:hypothetical protein
MLIKSNPESAADIAKEIKEEPRKVTMHLLGLIRMGYAATPEKGKYVLTEKGKQALGTKQTTKEAAQSILGYKAHDNAFSFYCDIGKPLNMHAHTLRDFANKLEKIDVKSIEFHVGRGDFEAWFTAIGDADLTKKTAAVKQKKLAGENLRKQLREVVEERYAELAKLSGQPIDK